MEIMSECSYDDLQPNFHKRNASITFCKKKIFILRNIACYMCKKQQLL